jgi:1-acyl-sn-glycerol-3-phosphate acyltransferase
VVEDGVSLLALRENVPVIPVYIHGKPRPFHRIHTFIGAPLDIPADRRDPNRENALFVNELIRDTFRHMRDTANGKDKKDEQIG